MLLQLKFWRCCAWFGGAVIPDTSVSRVCQMHIYGGVQNKPWQQTIMRSFSMTGMGLHTGMTCAHKPLLTVIQHETASFRAPCAAFAEHHGASLPLSGIQGSLLSIMLHQAQ